MLIRAFNFKREIEFNLTKITDVVYLGKLIDAWFFNKRNLKEINLVR